MADEADYLSRYPGDAFIDVVGFDMYHRDASEDDLWMDGFAKTMKVVGDFATKHNKVAAVTETGMLYNNAGALRKSGNSRLNWWNEALAQISPQNMAYFMTWANFDDTNFDQPYMVSKNRGQELANGFIMFYNEDASVFMNESADFTKIAVKKSVAKDAYAYMLAPSSYQRVLGDLQLVAKLGGDLSDEVPVLLNMAVPAENPLVDDFDNYITKSTEPQLIMLPFDSFKGKNGGRLEPANIKHFGIYCNTVGEKTVDSVMYFDDIQAVK